MFDAIRCAAVDFRVDGVHTLFYFRPADIDAEFDSWGGFLTVGLQTRITVELASDVVDHGRYSVTTYRPNATPHIIDRTDLQR